MKTLFVSLPVSCLDEVRKALVKTMDKHIEKNEFAEASQIAYTISSILSELATSEDEEESK